MSVETVIAVHPPFAWLVDWLSLGVADRRWLLVTSAESLERLERDGCTASLAGAVACPAFDVETLCGIVEPWIAACRDRASIRLATMIEPMQMPVAQLRERFGVPGPSPSQMRVFTDKLAMKAAMRGVDAYLPRHVRHDPAAFSVDPMGYASRVVARLGLPVFAKPVNENSSAGAAKLATERDLVAFLHRSPHELELDEYVPGDGYHLDSVVIDGRIAWFGAGRYAAPQEEALRGAPLAGISIATGDPLHAELARVNAKLLGAFDRVPDGCTHLEVLRRPDGRWAFLEVAARTPGSRIPEMYAISRGVDLRRIHYRVQAELLVDLDGERGPHAAWYGPMKTKAGRIVRAVAPAFESRHTMSWTSSWLERTDTASSISMADCLGFAVLWHDDRAVIERDLARLDGFTPYELAVSA